VILFLLKENDKSGAFKRGSAPLFQSSPSPSKERGIKGVR
jgi:hypothetical protein